MSAAPDTFLLTLPDGQTARCWSRDAEALREDIARTGTVCLVRATGAEVYERVEPESSEAESLAPTARRIG